MTRLLLLAALIGISGGAQASIVAVNATWNLNIQFFTGPISGGPVTIANGDHVVYTVDFTGNQTLNFADGNEFLWTAVLGSDNNSIFTINNISLDLLGFSGTGGAASSYAIASQSGGASHLGPQWTNFLSAGQTVSFGGFEVEFDGQSIAVSPHQYANNFLEYSGDHVSIGTAQAAPEPATLALLTLGLAGLGFSRRKQ